jgi:lipopolysaccharide/colanic/teichoic acid biosynthesis glycosyltransferase
MAQTRIGQYGRAFKIYKIRTMNPNVHLPPGSPHKLKDDPRVGRVGRFLRKTSIDELPQFWNVLIGNMTLVGPRPELPEIVAHYAPWQHERHVVPPGITGWWQILWRSEKPLHHSTEDDIYYVKNRCLLLDLQILLRTPGVVFRGHGAY